MYGLDSGVASSGSGGSGMGQYASLLQKFMGGMGGGKSGGGAPSGAALGGGGLNSGQPGEPVGPPEGTWGANNSGAGPNLVGSSKPIGYQPPPPNAPAPQDQVMRPRTNAGGDFWGPVVQRMIQQYLEQQRKGGPLSGMGNLGTPGRGGEPIPMAE